MAMANIAQAIPSRAGTDKRPVPVIWQIHHQASNSHTNTNSATQGSHHEESLFLDDFMKKMIM
jgi:hypothetical protein